MLRESGQHTEGSKSGAGPAGQVVGAVGIVHKGYRAVTEPFDWALAGKQPGKRLFGYTSYVMRPVAPKPCLFKTGTERTNGL